jgi:hypothetical protein
VRTTTEHRFVRGDPVCAYWLAHCEGFVVERPNGRLAGVVADVVLDDRAEAVAAVSVERRKRRRPLTVPAQRVAAVIPARRAVVLAPKERPPRGPGRTRTAGAAAVRGAGRGSVRLARIARGGSVRAAGGARRLWAALDRLAERAWRGLVASARTSALPAARRAWRAADRMLETAARRTAATWRQLREDGRRRRDERQPGA